MPQKPTLSVWRVFYCIQLKHFYDKAQAPASSPVRGSQTCLTFSSMTRHFDETVCDAGIRMRKIHVPIAGWVSLRPLGMTGRGSFYPFATVYTTPALLAALHREGVPSRVGSPSLSTTLLTKCLYQ